jgi:TonB-dependent starch-binding outer membrane protein SusC
MKQLFILALLCPFLGNCQNLSLKGKIVNEQGDPVAGATITITGTHRSYAANEKGAFALTGLHINDTLTISAIGYAPQSEVFDQTLLDHELTIVLHQNTATLDEVLLIAYGKTTRRFNTGSVSSITASDIASQPVSNPLSAMQGLVPGLVVTQRTGRPGSSFTVQLRGINSLKQGTQPLFIVDGMPFSINTGSLSQQLTDVSSIFNTINPSDIESIEVLKDADATAIFGSLAANGAVLITTKKASPGKSKFDASVYTGWGRPTRLLPLLNTAQYLQMRREAFANDGIPPTATSAPDLLAWDTTRYTDWQKQLIGGTARVTNFQASLSGGTATITYLVSANHYREASVFPGSKPLARSSARLNLSHTSLDKKFAAHFNSAYAVDSKNQSYSDLTSFTLLPPNAPALFDSLGRLAWTAGIENPMATALTNYTSQTANLLSNASFDYHFLQSFLFRLDLGYNTISFTEQRQVPIKALRPSATTTGTFQLSGNDVKSWLAEPQLTFTHQFLNLSFDWLAGLSFQQRQQTGTNVLGTGFTNDDLIGSIGAAGTLSASNSFTQYNYAAAFSRISLNYQNKYLLNLNARRDASSRFGPANRFANFGALGAAWIFSEEKPLQKSFLSYGRLRGSWGLTGNDQVGDYQFYDTWSSSTFNNYNGVAGILPTRLFNPSFQWEKTKKLELALELGLAHDRLFITVDYYRNRSSNQLLAYKLPIQTGFNNILKNLDAQIQNYGTELTLSAKPVQGKQLAWQFNINLSVPTNKLLAYPGLATSSDKFNYTIGQPVSLARTFTYTGIDPVSGLYTFLDVDGNGIISSPADLSKITFIGPRYFGGFQNQLQFRSWQLSFLFFGLAQTGRNYLTNIASRPGTLGNQPLLVLDRWQKPGDVGVVQKFSAAASSPSNAAYNNFRNSSAAFGDASFIRLRNLSLSYTLPGAWLKRQKLQSLRCYIEGQNLLTITGYKGADPENQTILSLPPLKLLAVGIQLSF